MIKRTQAHSTCRLALQPGRDAIAALDATFAARDALFDWLDATVPAEQSSDLVALNRLYYEPARSQFGLPAQMVVLAFRDWTRRRKGDPVDGIALDDKLFSVRGIATASIATVEGRHQFPFVISGYLPGWRGSTTARLLRGKDGYEVQIAAEAVIQGEEKSMATENIVGRIGRLIAGMAHGAVDSAERANPRAVLEQAIREIDSAAEEVRVELGKKAAERFRVESRRKELGGELAELDRTIAIAVKQDRDDLAAAGIERQLDIESQIAVLEAVLKDIDDSVAQFNSTLDAVRASRREAESRLADIARQVDASGAAGVAGQGNNSRAAARVERAEAAVARVTGVPGGLAPASGAVDELRQLARDHAVKERLARLKSDR